MDFRTASGVIGKWREMKVIAIKEDNFVIEDTNRWTLYALTNGDSDLKLVHVRDGVAKQLGTIDRDGNVKEFSTPKVYKILLPVVEKKENKFECHKHEDNIDLEELMKPIDEYINEMLKKSEYIKEMLKKYD